MIPKIEWVRKNSWRVVSSRAERIQTDSPAAASAPTANSRMVEAFSSVLVRRSPARPAEDRDRRAPRARGSESSSSSSSSRSSNPSALRRPSPPRAPTPTSPGCPPTGSGCRRPRRRWRRRLPSGRSRRRPSRRCRCRAPTRWCRRGAGRRCGAARTAAPRRPAAARPKPPGRRRPRVVQVVHIVVELRHEGPPSIADVTGTQAARKPSGRHRENQAAIAATSFISQRGNRPRGRRGDHNLPRITWPFLASRASVLLLGIHESAASAGGAPRAVPVVGATGKGKLGPIRERRIQSDASGCR